MRDIGIRGIVIIELAVEAATSSYFDICRLVKVQDAGHVGTRRVGSPPIERNDQSNRYAHLAEIFSHGHYGVGAEGMAHKYYRSTPARSIIGGNFVRNSLPRGVIGDGGG